MTFLRLSGKNLVSASCGSYMWVSASNTREENSRDGMAISLQKSGFSAGGNDVTTSAQQAVTGLGPGQARGQSGSFGVAPSMTAKFTVAVASSASWPSLPSPSL